ncbi:hypothetical protein ACSQ67_011007 [Phaseolus vulgaris]
MSFAQQQSSVVEVLSLNRSSFPTGFVFGTASAAYQYEGAANEGGRKPSVWDEYTHKHPERINDRSNGDVAVDQYHRYKEDVQIMKNMNLDAYRFSISWSRILPSLQPYVTLFHWDLPQALEEEYRGFLSPRVVTTSKFVLKILETAKQYKDASKRALDFMFGWYMEPLISGKYPSSMRSLVGKRLPKFSNQEAKLLAGSFDFLGLNYYTSYYAANTSKNNKPSYTTDANLLAMGFS